MRETTSCDTIGNAYFARAIHTDPAGYRNLCVITSDFHMPRTEAIFRWIFSAAPAIPPYQLAFEATSSEGLPDSVKQMRLAKEEKSLAALAPQFGRLTTMKAIHSWLFSKHQLYSVGLSSAAPVDDGVLSTY